MSARYDHDYEAFDKHVLCAPFMVAHLETRAGRVLAHAEAHAPYDATDVDGRHYRDAFSIGVGIRLYPTRRAFAQVSNSDPAALFVEYGSVHNPRHRTLGNALDAAKE